jgi:large subunit ribosomal protein L17
MRHRKGGFKLQRDASARRALLRSLTTSVILRDRVVTTTTKAKAVKPWVDRMITLGKRDTLHSRRQAASFLQEPEAVKRLFDSVAPRFSQRNGGYSRVLLLGHRKGDGAEQAMIEIVGAELKKRAEDRRKRREERLKRQQEEAQEAETAPAES